MKNIGYLFFFSLVFIGCKESEVHLEHAVVNWHEREIEFHPHDTMESGISYLSVYSQIYSQTEQNTKNLTVTVSMRNTDLTDTTFINGIDYYNTKGELIKSYINQTIYLLPMETIEVIIDEADKTGGTGGNFLFKWQHRPNTSEPLFEAIMISTAGQQGLSFSTTGKRVK